MLKYQLTFRNADAETRMSLAGATFQLVSEEGDVRVAVANDGGMVEFYPVPTGRYVLMETVPPYGYQLNRVRYDISVCGCGHCCVNGQQARMFVFVNEAIRRADVLYMPSAPFDHCC